MNNAEACGNFRVDIDNGRYTLSTDEKFGLIQIKNEEGEIRQATIGRFGIARIRSGSFNANFRRAGLFFRYHLSAVLDPGDDEGDVYEIHWISRTRYLLAMRVWLSIACLGTLLLGWTRIPNTATNLVLTLIVGAILAHLLEPKRLRNGAPMVALLLLIGGIFLWWDLFKEVEWYLSRASVHISVAALVFLSIEAARFWKIALTAEEKVVSFQRESPTV